MEDLVFRLIDKYNLVEYREKFSLYGVKSMKQLAQIDKTALRSQYNMLPADIDSFENLRNEAIRYCNTIQPNSSQIEAKQQESVCELVVEKPVFYYENKTIAVGGNMNVKEKILPCQATNEPQPLKSLPSRRSTIIDIYDLNTECKYSGFGLIFVTNCFGNGESRPGYARDSENLTKIFDMMHLRTHTIGPDIPADSLAKKIYMEIDDNKVCPSFFVAISIEGVGDNRIVCSDNNSLPIQDIINVIQIFQDKPKVLLIEAGGFVQNENIEQQAIPYSPTKKDSDTLLVYSCLPGGLAERDELNGSSFINSLHSAYASIGKDYDLVSVLTYVNQLMHKKVCEDQHFVRQTAHIESTLTKLLFI